MVFVKSMNYCSLTTKHEQHDAMFLCDIACTNVVDNSCNLATESNIPLIYRDNSLRKVNFTFKRGFIVLKLAKTLP